MADAPPAPPLLLASTSPQRRAILEQLRVPFDVVSPRYHEQDVEKGDAVELVRRHAREKARSASCLSNVKQLSGLLPICSYCKRIRGDDQYWQQVEGYIAQHSEAQFSHGICPSCYATVSAELDEVSRRKAKP